MSDEGGGVVHKLTERGITGTHPSRSVQPFLVAPTTSSEEFNTLEEDLIPVACLTLADILFEFDSSFVLPNAALVLKDLPGLRDAHKGADGELPPINIFGHADPVGDDEYNKQLSGRRAKAIFGLLTHDTGVWDQLNDSPFGGDNWKTKKVLDTIKESLGATSAPLSRKELFQAYMSALSPVPLTKNDFLARGEDAKGKADFQGCSEFNPLVVLSKSENQTLAKADRDQANQPNRRVVIYLYRPGSKVTASSWPCPRANEGTAGCRLRFFASPKGDDRRKAGDQRREHDKLIDTEQDTFACRFYDRVSHLSPCETQVLSPVCCRVRGVVVNNQDPAQMGRLQVNVPSLPGTDLKFAMPCVPYAGPGVGFYFIPPVGANVWVEFEGGNPDQPIWTGCLWGQGEVPAEALPVGKKVIKTENVTVVMDDTPGGDITIQVGSAKLTLGPQGVVVENGQGARVTLAGPAVDVNNGEMVVT